MEQKPGDQVTKGTKTHFLKNDTVPGVIELYNTPKKVSLYQLSKPLFFLVLFTIGGGCLLECPFGCSFQRESKSYDET